jgi:hypothetical protein
VRRTFVAVLAGAALLLAGAPTAAGAATVDAQARQLAERALEQTFGAPPCEVRPEAGQVPEQAVTDAALSGSFTGPFALFRRAPGEQELRAAGSPALTDVIVEETYRQGTRIVALGRGLSARIQAHARASRPGISPQLAQCVSKARSAIQRLGRGRPRAVVRRALGLVPAVRSRPASAGEGLTLSVLRRGTPVARAGTVVTPGSLERRAPFVVAGEGRGSRFVGLVPDAVQTVDLKYPAIEFTLTTEVIGNVVSVGIPLPRGQARPKQIIWRDASGRALRTIRP